MADGAEKRIANRALLEHVISLYGTDRAGELAGCYTTYIALWRFRDGRVCGVKEFPNPMVAAEALALGPVDERGDDLPEDEEE